MLPWKIGAQNYKKKSETDARLEDVNLALYTEYSISPFLFKKVIKMTDCLIKERSAPHETCQTLKHIVANGKISSSFLYIIFCYKISNYLECLIVKSSDMTNSYVLMFFLYLNGLIGHFEHFFSFATKYCNPWQVLSFERHFDTTICWPFMNIWNLKSGVQKSRRLRADSHH